MDCETLRDERLDVIYGEATPDAYRRVHEHLALCSACREEMEALRRLRRTLAEWRVPERAAPHTRRWLGLAAAVLLPVCWGAALGLSGSELRYEAGQLGFRLGRGPDVQRLLGEQQVRHEAAIRTALAAPEQAAPERDRALLRRIETMIRASEARQAVLLGAGLTELSEQVQAQRRYDLARVSASLSYLEGRQGQELARTSELMGYVLQAAEKRK